MCFLLYKTSNFITNSLIKVLNYEDFFKSLSRGPLTLEKKVYQLDLANR